MDKSSGTSWVALVLAVGLVVSLVALVVSNAATSEPADILTVTGTAKSEVEPDKAIVYMAVESNASTALEAQQKNAQLSSAVIAALEAQGIVRGNIQTSSYQVYPEYSYTEGGRDFLGYRASQGIKVTVEDTGRVGQLVDVATAAGVNRFDSVQFTVSDSKQQELRASLLAKASGQAKDIASSMAAATGVRLKGVKSVSESSPSFTPLYVDAAKVIAESASDLPPGKVELAASVTITYRI